MKKNSTTYPSQIIIFRERKSWVFFIILLCAFYGINISHFIKSQSYLAGSQEFKRCRRPFLSFT